MGNSREAFETADSVEITPEPNQSNGQYRSDLADATGDVFRACIEHAPIGFSITDLNGHFISVNRSYCSITGYTESELCALDFQTITHPADLPATYTKIKELLAGTIPPFVLEKRYIRKDGTVVWVQDSVSLIRDNEGRPIHLVGLSQDISEQKRAEESLRQAQTRTESILASVFDVHIVFDRQWRYLYLNNAAVQAIGKPLEYLLGRTLWEIYPDIIGTELERQYRRAMDEGVSVAFAFHYQTSETWWENRFHPTPEGLAVFATDISERKHAEELLRQSEKEFAEAQHLATVGSWAWNIKTNRMRWSDEFCRILGFWPQEFPVTFEKFLEGVHPDDRKRVAWTVENCIKTHGRYSHHHRIIRPDGQVRLVHALGNAVCDEAGTPLRMIGVCHDITELENTKNAQREAEQKYQEIFENAGEGIFQSTPEGQYLTANPALARMHGFDTPEELIRARRDISRDVYVNPSRREEFKRLLKTHGMVRGFEHQFFRKDGSKIWISVNARAVRDESGKIRYYEGTAQDITERRQTEEALRESEERYRDLVENSQELICTHDLEGRILSANRAALELLGYTPTEFSGKNIRDVLAPEVRNQFEDYMARIQREGAASGLMLVQTSSGERRVWEYYNSLRTEGVASPIVRGIGRDITERRRAERALRESEGRYRELFENSKDAIYVHDMSGRYTSVNRAAEMLSGYSREEILGQDFGYFVAPEHVRQVRENFYKKLEELSETTYEIEIITKDKRRVPVEVSSRLIYADGVAVGVQGTVRDITERKRAQDASRTYSRRLLQVQEAERRRISLELHDQIGQVLTALKINLHTLQDKCETADTLACIGENLKVVDEAYEQVKNLSVDLRPLVLDDFGLTVALRWYLKRQSKSTGVPSYFLSRSVGKNERFSSALETACFRIVQEAVTNIVRHARASQFLVRLEKDASDLVLSIKDNGVGFDVKALRSSSVIAPTLGLRGMAERAEAVGGTLATESVVGNGTEICARFPIEREKSRDSNYSGTEREYPVIVTN